MYELNKYKNRKSLLNQTLSYGMFILLTYLWCMYVKCIRLFYIPHNYNVHIIGI